MTDYFKTLALTLDTYLSLHVKSLGKRHLEDMIENGSGFVNFLQFCQEILNTCQRLPNKQLLMRLTNSFTLAKNELRFDAQGAGTPLNQPEYVQHLIDQIQQNSSLSYICFLMREKKLEKIFEVIGIELWIDFGENLSEITQQTWNNIWNFSQKIGTEKNTILGLS